MEGGYLAANIGKPRTFRSHYIVHNSKEKKKKSIRLFQSGNFWENFFKSERLKNTLKPGNVQRQLDGGKQAPQLIPKALTLHPKVGTSNNPRSFCQEQGQFSF